MVGKWTQLHGRFSTDGIQPVSTLGIIGKGGRRFGILAIQFLMENAAKSFDHGNAEIFPLRGPIQSVSNVDKEKR